MTLYKNLKYMNILIKDECICSSVSIAYNSHLYIEYIHLLHSEVHLNT